MMDESKVAALGESLNLGASLLESEPLFGLLLLVWIALTIVVMLAGIRLWRKKH
jgi:hypothetical protein